MKSNILKHLENINKNEVNSLLLWALFVYSNIPEYSNLSKLAYLLDEDSFFNFLSYYGGQTIKVPTVEEFKIVANALLLYYYINIQNIDYDDAVNQLLLSNKDLYLDKINDAYFKLIKEFDKFNSR